MGHARPSSIQRNDVQGQSSDNSRIEQMAKALQLMTEALRLLDEARAPAQPGAHLDLAIVRLAEAIPTRLPEG